MKNLLLLSTVVAVMLVSACQKKPSPVTEMHKISHTIASEMAPDAREAVYEVEFKMLSHKKVLIKGETSLPKAKENLKAQLQKIGLQLVDSLVLLPSPELGDKNWGIINLSVANLRAEPEHSAEMVSQALLGTPIKVLKEQNDWYLIQTPDNYIAWVDETALSLKNKMEMETWRNDSKIVFLPTFGIAYEPPINGLNVVTDLVSGNILQVIKEESNNYILKMPDEREIIMTKSLCMDFQKWKKKPTPKAEEIITTAKGFIGSPYLWGGTSSKGIDCSGFVKTAYFLNGIILARDASQQFRYGDKIEPEQGWETLKKGDLIFFGRPATDENAIKVVHVGMYIGNSEFIHSAGRVKINSLDAKRHNYADRTWLGGRRLLTKIGEQGIVKVADHNWY